MFFNSFHLLNLDMVCKWSKMCLDMVLFLMEWGFALCRGLSVTSGSSTNVFTIWIFLSQKIHFHWCILFHYLLKLNRLFLISSKIWLPATPGLSSLHIRGFTKQLNLNCWRETFFFNLFIHCIILCVEIFQFGTAGGGQYKC